MTPIEASAQLSDGAGLRTERLLLRLPEAAWAPALRDYHLRNAEHFAPYCPRRPPGFHALEAWRERAVVQREASLAGYGLHLLLFSSKGSANEIIGDVNVTNIIRGAFQAAYLGYALDAAHVGKGLMYEALLASITHVFAHLNLHRLMANHVPSNERSGRLLRRLGFSVEGYARDYLRLDGVWKDHVLTSLLNPHFRVEE